MDLRTGRRGNENWSTGVSSEKRNKLHKCRRQKALPRVKGDMEAFLMGVREAT